MQVNYRIVTIRHAFGWRQFTSQRRLIVSNPVIDQSEEDTVPDRTSPALPARHIDRPLWPTSPSCHSGHCECGVCPSCRLSERPEFRPLVRSYLAALLRQVADTHLHHPDVVPFTMEDFDLANWDGLVHDARADRPTHWVRLCSVDGTTWVYDDAAVADLVRNLHDILAAPATN